MKKVIIVIIMLIIVVLSYVVINSNPNINEVLEKFENHESDGYLENNEEASGYIVSNKTQDGYRYGYVNYKGKILLEAEYNHVHRVMEIKDKDKIYLIAAKNGRYGVNYNGKDIIKYEYQFIEYNSTINGFILQKTEDYGVANAKGQIIIPVKNDKVEVKGNYIYVTNQDEGKVYDKNGKEQQIDFNTTINPTDNPKYLIKTVQDNDKYLYGIIDNNGKELIKPQFTYIEYLFKEYFIACNSEGKEGIIDSNGNIKLEFRYNLVQKIQNTNLIRTINNEDNTTELFSEHFEKIYTIKNANIENDGSTIKVYNENEEKYFDKNGIEIKK